MDTKPPFGQSSNSGSDLHGSARWMTADQATQAGLFKPQGVLLGQTLNGQPFRFNGDGHIMVFAPTGAGKGIGFVQPNLAEYSGSMVVLDPKGENAIVSAELRRKKGQQVIILDPFNKTGMGTATYNPLSALTYADEENLGPMVEGIADALVPVSSGERDPHWPLGAKKFISLLLWFLIAHEAPQDRHLVRLFELAHKGYSGVEKMARVMIEGRHPDPEVRRMCSALGNWFLGRQPKEFSYFESQALNNLGWIGDAVWSKILACAPTQPLPLKSKALTVYLVLPFNRIERYRPWLRVMVTDLIASLYETPGALETPVLFLLDEAYSGLGYMENLFAAAAAVRGAGGRLCFIYQDVQQVEKLYGKAWTSLIANSGVTLFWSVNDLEAARYISEFAGARTVALPSQPSGMSQNLLRTEQVFQLPSDEIIALFRSLPPAKFGRFNALTDARFNSKLAKNTTYNAPLDTSGQATKTARSWVPVDLDAEIAGAAPGQKPSKEAQLLEAIAQGQRNSGL